MNDDYSAELADAIATVAFGRGACVEQAAGGFVVARYRREWNEAIRPAGSCIRNVLGRGRTRREAIDETRRATAARDDAARLCG